MMPFRNQEQMQDFNGPNHYSGGGQLRLWEQQLFLLAPDSLLCTACREMYSWVCHGE